MYTVTDESRAPPFYGGEQLFISNGTYVQMATFGHNHGMFVRALTEANVTGSCRQCANRFSSGTSADENGTVVNKLDTAVEGRKPLAPFGSAGPDFKGPKFPGQSGETSKNNKLHVGSSGTVGKLNIPLKYSDCRPNQEHVENPGDGIQGYQTA